MNHTLLSGKVEIEVIDAASNSVVPIPKIDLRDAHAIRRELGSVYRDMRSGRITSQDEVNFATGEARNLTRQVLGHPIAIRLPPMAPVLQAIIAQGGPMASSRLGTPIIPTRARPRARPVRSSARPR